MKTVILSINSKYIHTLLAARYLKANCKGLNVEIAESNINIKLYDLLAEIYLKKPDVIAISCYIFNIEYVRNFLNEIKQLMPNVKIILGGYEVTFDVERYLPLCDYIIKGEGDFVFNDLLWDIKEKTNKFPKVIEAGTIKNLDDIISPYDREYCSLGKDKIIYFETGRGCPFCCSYCMSANTRGVRSFKMERIISDLNKIMSYEPKQIKFVDRTFNFDTKRATKIFKFVIENFSDKDTNFHFEMAPELFDEDMFSMLKRAKKGLIQFEIGVQSYNPKTLESVGRIADVDRVDDNIKRLISFKNIHIHVDLIAGLPDENLESFINGFDRLFNLKPDCLQLGFLKVLKGSKMYNEKQQGIIMQNAPPYEIYSTQDLSFDEILQLKNAENMLDLYYNSQRFYKSLNFLLPDYFKPYQFFYDLGIYIKDNGYSKKNLAAFTQCEMLFNFVSGKVLDIETQKKQEFINTLKRLINEDYAGSGNIRKWKRFIE